MRTPNFLCIAASATIFSAAIFSAAIGAQQQSSELRSRPASEETAINEEEAAINEEEAAINIEPDAARAASPASRQHAEPPSKARHSPSTIRHRVSTSSKFVAVAPNAARVRESEVRKELRDKVNSGLVGIVLATEAEKPTLFGVADFFGSLEQNDSLRVFQIEGKGSSQNVIELGFARGVDAAIIQSDVLDSIRHKPPYPDIENYLQYVATLYHKQVHVLASSDVSSIDDLKGKKVNFGSPKSDNALTVTNVFHNLHIDVEPTELPHTLALEKLRQGEIAALVYVGTKPADLFNFGNDGRLHFLSIPASPTEADPVTAAIVPTAKAGDVTGAGYTAGGYTLGTVNSEDYPQLIERDKPVQTLAVGAVLMVYNWPHKSDRYRKVSRFVETLLNHTNVPAVAPVDVGAPLQGWTRFAPAEKWISAHDLTSQHAAAPQSGEAEHASGATGEGSGSSVPPAARKMPAQLSRNDRIGLFKDFVAYQKNHAGE